jgi:mRNA-degrading endonuclease HigB of HigAB toxin-antitoxin module
VFNIEGNNCRLVVAIAHNAHTVFVKFVGTQCPCKAIDAIDAETVELA